MRIILLLLLISPISSVSYAGTACTHALNETQKQFKEMADFPRYGSHGFLSAFPKATDQNIQLAQSIKFNNQGERINMEFWEEVLHIVSSKKAAEEHHSRYSKTWPGEDFENPHMFSLYLVLNKKSNIKEVRLLKETSESVEKLRELFLVENFFQAQSRKNLAKAIRELEKENNNELSSKIKDLNKDIGTSQKKLDSMSKKIKALNQTIKETISVVGLEKLIQNSSPIGKKYVHNGDNYWETIPLDFFDRFNAVGKKAKVLVNNQIDGPLFKQTGWTTADYKAIVRLGVKKGKTIKNQERFARKQIANGHKYTHKVSVRAVAEKCRDQKRRGKKISVGRMDEDFINSYEEMEKRGEAFAYAEIDADGELISGMLGFYVKNEKGQILTAVGESTFYPTHRYNPATGEQEYFLGGIDHSKALGRNLFNIFEKSGMTFIDAQSVSAFTRVAYRGEYVFPNEYDQMLSEQTPIDEILWGE